MVEVRKGIIQSPLARHLSVALLLKAVALAVLWHLFVAPQKKHIDMHEMTARIATPKEVSLPKETRKPARPDGGTLVTTSKEVFLAKEAFTDDRFDCR